MVEEIRVRRLSPRSELQTLYGRVDFRNNAERHSRNETVPLSWSTRIHRSRTTTRRPCDAEGGFSPHTQKCPKMKTGGVRNGNWKFSGDFRIDRVSALPEKARFQNRTGDAKLGEMKQNGKRHEGKGRKQRSGDTTVNENQKNRGGA